MNHSAMLPFLAPISETPFSARRGALEEGLRMMVLLGRAVPSKFRPPPLPSVFGPGTKLPKGPALPKPPRKSKKR